MVDPGMTASSIRAGMNNCTEAEAQECLRAFSDARFGEDLYIA